MKSKGLLLGLLLTLSLGLASCGINEKSAEKINVAAAKDDHYTYAEVIDKYGTPTINGVASGFGLGESGACTWYEGCDSVEEKNEKLEAGKKVEVLIVTFLNGKAVSAEYKVLTSKDDE